MTGWLKNGSMTMVMSSTETYEQVQSVRRLCERLGEMLMTQQHQHLFSYKPIPRCGDVIVRLFVCSLGIWNLIELCDKLTET